MKKSSVQLALNPFLHGTSKTPKFDFGYIQDQSLIPIASSRRNSPFAKKEGKQNCENGSAARRWFCALCPRVFFRLAFRGSVHRSQKKKNNVLRTDSLRGFCFFPIGLSRRNPPIAKWSIYILKWYDFYCYFFLNSKIKICVFFPLRPMDITRFNKIRLPVVLDKILPLKVNCCAQFKKFPNLNFPLF